MSTKETVLVDTTAFLILINYQYPDT